MKVDIKINESNLRLMRFEKLIISSEIRNLYKILKKINLIKIFYINNEGGGSIDKSDSFFVLIKMVD